VFGVNVRKNFLDYLLLGKKDRKVFCHSKKSGKCIGGRVSAPKNLIGKRVYLFTVDEIDKLRKYVATLESVKTFFRAILNSNNGSKMFSIVGETWNPISGCLHHCRYCWARRLALTKLRDTRRYRNGFKPRLNEEEFRKRFKGGVVFVSDMGDIFSPGVEDSWVIKVLRHIRKFPDTYFLFLTKNPTKYKDFLDLFPSNCILGATIETNKDDLYIEYKISSAPLPSIRYQAMKELDWPYKFVSIEPILDFDLDIFVRWIKEINPFMMYVGYDNYNNRLPEPPLRKTLRLIEKLNEFTLVIKKTIRPAWNEKESILNYVGSGDRDRGEKKF